jgi:hypothetical protein
MDHLAEGLRDYLTDVHSEKDSKMDAEDPDPAAAGKGGSPQGVPLQGKSKILSTPTNLEGAPGEVTAEAIAELFKEEKIGTPTDDVEAVSKMAKLKEDSEGRLGENAGSGAGVPTDAELPSPDLAHVTSPSLHSASLDPSGRAGKYGDTVAPVRTESSSLLDTSGLVSGDSGLEEVQSAATAQTEEEKLRLFTIQQQVSREGSGGEDMRTPVHRRSLASDMLKETNNMALWRQPRPCPR